MTLSQGYRRYVLSLLAVVYGLTYVDRCLIVLLLQPIKDDLHLSDTQLGFVTGIAFGLFYATLGVPIARWADRGNRVSIASLAIGLWGLTVMATLLVRNFALLVVVRIAAAVGESGSMPPTYSLLGDYFPAAGERTRAMALYMLGPSVAALLSFAVGGQLNDYYGWRYTFFLMGSPALLLAVVVKLSAFEPRTEAVANSAPAVTPPLSAVLGSLWRRDSTLHLSIAIILLWTMGLGLQPWYAAFMMRSHGMATGELGLWLGIIFGLSGIVGILLGGYVVARWFHGNEQGQFQLTALTTAALVPIYMLFLLVPQKHQALVALIPIGMVFNFLIGPTFAILQRLVPSEMRATTMAVVMLLANLIGMGLGPQLVGLLSDLLVSRFGNDSLRYSMLIMSVIAFWAAYHFLRVGRTVSDDLVALSLPPGVVCGSRELTQTS